ncbi:twin-arginine translocation pathway signal [Magnetococcus marinus MC-1]|uniref:Twin-arginine translocation pathway signal n=1 Tax=Magnetococcus marinus (strain ATCC BAA-1437 / JCM 17883 / MC-1) TaxID=156889 RepID=A0LCW0_MAGMM|nr:MBL fold metallo-hydrolase [Magnetococcus marinus]ABK45803.1 twin-arginine translocation pathway signal [Magnetococcus marinus MC-1]
MLKIALGLLLLIVLGLLMRSMLATPYYGGPLSDHFDGQRFYDTQTPPKRFLDLFKWKLFGEKTPWPEWVEIAPQPAPPKRVAGGALRLTFVNHNTVLIQTAGLNILTDPQWSQRASPVRFLGPRRVHAPGVALADLPPIDVVLISHSHYDHMDRDTLQQLYAQHKPRILVGLGGVALLHEMGVPAEALDWGGHLPLTSVVEAHFVQVKHWSARTLWDRNQALWGGFVLTTAHGNLYFGGDCGYSDAFVQQGQRYGPFRLALLPMGHYAPRWFMRHAHMNPAEAVQAHTDLAARYTLGIHWGTFPLTDEGRTQPLQDLAVALQAGGVDAEHFRTLQPGESWLVPE